MTKPLAGMYAALMTGMDDGGDFDPVRQRSLNAFVLRQGLHGLYVGGSSAEAGLMDTEALLEQQAVVAEDAKGSGATLIAHVGLPSVAASIRLAKHACVLGYHGLSALPPHSYPFSDGEIRDYYGAVAAATNLPLIVYEVPIRTGRALPLALLVEILDLPGVAGIKFSSTDLFKMSQLCQACPNSTIFFGFDEIFLAGAVLGADGGIGSTYNLLGRLYAALAEALKVKDLTKAQRLQTVSSEFVTGLMEVGILPGMKAALRAVGLECGPTRAPMNSQKPDCDARMRELIAKPSIRVWLP